MFTRRCDSLWYSMVMEVWGIPVYMETRRTWRHFSRLFVVIFCFVSRVSDIYLFVSVFVTLAYAFSSAYAFPYGILALVASDFRRTLHVQTARRSSSRAVLCLKNYQDCEDWNFLLLLLVCSQPRSSQKKRWGFKIMRAHQEGIGTPAHWQNTIKTVWRRNLPQFQSLLAK